MFIMNMPKEQYLLGFTIYIFYYYKGWNAIGVSFADIYRQ